jgi:RimJ/RimL family protein N-acetyltransferase
VGKSLQLTGGAVSLRPYRKSDVYHVYEAVTESTNELSPWLDWCHPDYSIKETRTWVESCDEAWNKGTDYNFAIIDLEKGAFLGSCGVIRVHRQFGFAELGYWVRTGRTRQGIATAAANLLVPFGFSQLKLNRIEIVVATGNKASQRVAEKVGAIREGVLRNRFVVQDKVYDAVMFSLIPKDVTLSD